MKSKKNKNKVIGLYALHGVKNESAIKIKHLETGILSPDQKIQDTSIHKYEINSYIAAEILQCNITDTDLVASKKQPVLYTKIALIKPLKLAILCNIVLYFTIEDDIKSREQLLTNSLGGKFTLELGINGNYRKLDTEIKTFISNQDIIDMIVNLTKDDTMVAILEELAEIEEERIAQKYRGEIEYFSPPEVTISLRDYKVDNYEGIDNEINYSDNEDTIEEC
jgi:hypothetical protein